MLYDRQKMQPLFRLSIGQPGSSFALEIARKTGLPETVIEQAKSIVGSDYVNMDKYLLDIARDRRYWENKRQDIRQKEKRVDEVLVRYEGEMETLRGKHRAIISEARDEARRILDSSNAAIERTIREIRLSQADKERTREARRQLESVREALHKESSADLTGNPLLDKKVPSKKKKAERAPKISAVDRALQPGDNVLLDEGGTVGTIADISGKNATVVFGSMKMNVKLDRLKRTIRKADSGAAKGGVSYISGNTADSSRERQLSFNNEIDVRGMRAAEALEVVQDLVDDALMVGVSGVTILHGKGTGALKEEIRRYLRGVPEVASARDEHADRGGAGITVVTFAND